MTPEDTSNVNRALDNADFQAKWSQYVRYMKEKHNDELGEFREKLRISRIIKYAGNDIDLAIRMIQFFMDAGFVGIFDASNLINKL